MTTTSGIEARTVAGHESAGRACRWLLTFGLAVGPLVGSADVGDAKTLASGLSNPRHRLRAERRAVGG